MSDHTDNEPIGEYPQPNTNNSDKTAFNFIEMYWGTSRKAAFEELKNLIAQEANKAREEADSNITEPCECGHSFHSRCIVTDCGGCSCQQFTLKAEKGKA